MSDKVSQLYERALRNLKNSVSRALARRNESPIRVPQTPLTFHPLAQQKLSVVAILVNNPDRPPVEINR